MPRSKTVNVKEILQEDDDIQYPDSENIEYDDDDDDVVYEDDEDVNTDEDQDENWEQDENGDEDEDVNAGLVKPTGKGKKKPGVMVKSELVEIKTKGKKARIKAEVDANVPVDAENDVQILDGGCSTSNLTTQCRPTALLAVIETFNSNQIKSVSEIGFGWLLSLPTQTSKLDTTLFPWLIDHFDPVSWLFKIEAGKEFIFSPCDVHDVFLLPLHSDNPIVDSSTRTKDVGLKNQWRYYFKVKKNATIPLRLLEIKMGELVEGGEMFKRIFVMFAFSVFLAPIANRTADLGLVKVLEDVDEIKNLDWCGYVHERLCRAIRKHKTSGCQGNVGGCLWVLQVVYFHRLQFRGIAESCSLPLMKHWSGTKIHERLVLEKDSACFGSGLLNTVTYPVCQKLGFEEGFAKICGRHDAVNDDENHIRFVIPDGQLSNSAIQSISTDEILELLWQDSTNEAAMDQLLICWKEWIDIYNNGFDITCVDLVFVPFFRERHFFLFVLNLKTKTMQHVDNLVYDEAQIIDLESFSTTLCDLLGTFLDDRGNNHEGDIGTYPMEEIEFDWKTAKGSDLDCGIYTMISMLTFEGIKCSCPDLKEPRKRIVLRAEICATLVLSDMNDKRAEVLNKLADFNSKRVDVYPHVVTRRKQKLANDRKLKKEAAKKEKEVEKKAEENANENKKPEGKIAQENANENEKPEGNMAEMNNNVADVNDNAAEGNEQSLKTFTSRKRLKRNVADASVPENVGPPEKKQAPTKRTAKKPAA
ncbi:uncharacterized protein [Spinacia oleracea]|uniref:Ubiquitin-like protease family profile domain-containing protein n=1 Tax=Spinacia oleracea TaxID=3562 RepID=A0ABM3RBC2_SPIOL|nr:uncharacterized protein LOC130467906 [Spinacia oleracea]